MSYSIQNFIKIVGSTILAWLMVIALVTGHDAEPTEKMRDEYRKQVDSFCEEAQMKFATDPGTNEERVQFISRVQAVVSDADEASKRKYLSKRIAASSA